MDEFASLLYMANLNVVDGGAWHTRIQPGSDGNQWPYPDFLLADEEVTGVKGGKSKL